MAGGGRGDSPGFLNPALAPPRTALRVRGPAPVPPLHHQMQSESSRHGPTPAPPFSSGFYPSFPAVPAPPPYGLDQSDRPCRVLLRYIPRPFSAWCNENHPYQSVQAPSEPSPTAETTPWTRPLRFWRTRAWLRTPPLPDPALSVSSRRCSPATSSELRRARGAADMAVTAEGARRKERVLCLFDVDGTLTPARQVGLRRSESPVGNVTRTPGGLRWGLRRRDPDPRD